MSTDYTVLIVPGLVLLVFIIKYLVQRLYGLHYAKVETERLENLNRIMRNNPLLSTGQDMHSHHRIVAALRPQPPPPDYDRAQQCSLPIYYIPMEDDDNNEGPPPSYDEYMTRMTGQVTGQPLPPPPPYHPV